MTGAGLTSLGVDLDASRISAVARYGLLLIPLMGLILLLREATTIGRGAVPRFSYLMGVLLPIGVIAMVAYSFASRGSSLMELREGPTVARTVSQQVQDAAGPDASTTQIASAAATELRRRLSLGVAVCGLGMVFCMIALVVTAPGKPKSAGAGAGAADGSASSSGDDKTVMFRAESPSGGRTSVLNASAAAATDAALAALAKRNGVTMTSKKVDTAKAVGTAAAIEAALKAVDSPADASGAARRSLPAPATEEMPAPKDDPPAASPPMSEPLGALSTPVSAQHESALDLTADMQRVAETMKPVPAPVVDIDAHVDGVDPLPADELDAVPLPDPIATGDGVPAMAVDAVPLSDPFATPTEEQTAPVVPPPTTAADDDDDFGRLA
ncbi:MAG: hypothetical protein AB7K09_23745 [Planctomycetota bacterium]